MKIICLVSKITSIILIMASSRPKTRSATDHRLVGQEEREEKERAKVVKEILEKEAGSGYIDMSSESGGAGVTQQTLKSPWSLSRNKLLHQNISISAEGHVDLVAAFTSASGGDFSDFILSIVTGYRTPEKVAGIVTEKDKIEFRNICQDRCN